MAKETPVSIVMLMEWRNEKEKQGIIEGGYSTREALVDAWNLILDTEG